MNHALDSTAAGNGGSFDPQPTAAFTRALRDLPGGLDGDGAADHEHRRP